MKRFLSSVVLLAGFGTSLAAQGLPQYQSVNPVLTARSGLYFQPYLDRTRKWDVRLLMDLANMVEYTQLATADMVLDAEVFRLDGSVVRNLGSGFVGAEASYQMVNDGFLDGFLDWYHNLTGLEVKARGLRPRNQYAFQINLPAGERYQRVKPAAFAGDVRLIAGHRHTRHWQSVVAVTLPTGPEGFGREATSVSAVTTVRTEPSRRVVGEFSAGIGYTPAKGALASYQQTDFHSLSGGMRVRFWGKQAAFINLFYQSANYQGTTLRPLDQRELTLDYGFLLKARRGPEWFLGMTEDLEPKGPAIDLSFRIGARW